MELDFVKLLIIVAFEVCFKRSKINLSLNKLLGILIFSDFFLHRISFLFSWYARTDPLDVARVESKTVIATENERDTIPKTRPGVESQLGQWMSPEALKTALNQRMPGCMKGSIFIVRMSSV